MSTVNKGLQKVFNIEEGMIPEFSTKIKMQASGAITVVVEDKSGNLFITSKSLEVALGGCEG